VCTDASGHYVLPIATAGSYQVAFIDTGGRYVTTWAGGATTQSAASTVSVATRATTTGVNAALGEVQGISGTVTEAGTAKPIAGVCVYVYTTGGDRTSDPAVCTDSQGRYAQPVATTGSYDLAFYDPSGSHNTIWSGNAADEAHATPVAVTANRTTAGADAAMTGIQGISGTVTDAKTGFTVSGACVYLYTPGGHRTSDPGVCTGSGGTYVLPVASAGSYLVAFVDPSGDHVPTWSGNAGDEAHATPVTVSTARSTALNAAMPEFQGIDAFAFGNSAHPSAEVCGYLYTTSGQRTSDPGVCGSGKLQFSVAPGSYLLVVSDPGGSNETSWYDANTPDTSATTSMANATPITVTAGASSTVFMQLVPVQGLYGRMTDYQTGNPLSGVCLYPYSGGVRTSDPGVCTDTAGYFVLPIANAGSYELGLVDPSGVHQGGWYDDNGVGDGESVTPNQSLATPITVTAGNGVVEFVAMTDTAQGISGTIRNSVTGSPYSGVCVYADYGPSSASSGDYAGVGSCTGADGTYRLSGLGEGGYTLGYYLPGQSQSTPTACWYGGSGQPPATSEANAAEVTVTNLQYSTGTDVTLTPGRC
jgi:hypothetical protein